MRNEPSQLSSAKLASLGSDSILFLWALRQGQFEDMEGAATRILFDDDGPA